MTNTDKLKAVMKKYHIEKVYYYKGMNLDDDLLEGLLFFIGYYNKDFLTEVYYIYTPDGILLEDQDLDIWMALEGSSDYALFVRDDMEVLYV